MRVRETNKYTNIRDLQLRKQEHLFVEVKGMRYFLIGRNLKNIEKAFQLTIEEEIKNSTSRQIQDYCKGRIPQQYRKEVRTYYAKQLTNIPNGYYKVLEQI